MRIARIFLVLALFLGLVVAVPVLAAEQDMSGGAATSERPMDQGRQDMGADAGGAAPSDKAMDQKQAEMKSVEGKVRNVDMAKNEIKVGGWAGLFGTSLKVDQNTKFHGPAQNLQSLKEGDQVRASYRKVGDQNVATDITIVSEPGGAAAPSGKQPSGGGAPQAPSSSKPSGSSGY
jgi:Cu/Ag efflux protein CusF